MGNPMRVIAVMIDIADSAATNQNHRVLAAVGFSSFTISLRLQPDLDYLSRQPFCSKAFVVCMEFWLGLAVRYRLPRRKRVESPSLELVRNLLLGRPLRLDHLLFPFSPSSTRRRMAS